MCEGIMMIKYYIYVFGLGNLVNGGIIIEQLVVLRGLGKLEVSYGLFNFKVG